MKEKILNAIKCHEMLVEKFKSKMIENLSAISKTICESLKNGGCVYLCGNGGSAADCQHIAGEFVGRFKVDRKPLAAVAFSTDSSVITCIGNDYSFDDIFTRQTEALVHDGDVLWAFSTSGESANVVNAAKLAKEKKAVVIAFTGKSDTALEKISDKCVTINSDQTCRSQEVHQLAYHIICDLVETEMFADIKQ